MNWKELADFIGTKMKGQYDASVMVYDQSHGEYYACDLIEFESDGIIEQGTIFIKIETAVSN